MAQCFACVQTQQREWSVALRCCTVSLFLSLMWLKQMLKPVCSESCPSVAERRLVHPIILHGHPTVRSQAILH